MPISKEELKSLRERYPIGCRVELLQMDDTQAPPAGTKGTVNFIDDIGSYDKIYITETFILLGIMAHHLL